MIRIPYINDLNNKITKISGHRVRPSAHGKTVLQRESQMCCVSDCCAIGLQLIYVFYPHTSTIEF